MQTNRLSERSANRVRPYITVLEHQRAVQDRLFRWFAAQVARSSTEVG
ncbi:hypothetical protein NOGI109294_18885 [Nocardiopsis gilva]|nr:hypothetical protein [Nocardiopsis gilva]